MLHFARKVGSDRINTFSVQVFSLLALNLEQPKFKSVRDKTKYLKCFPCHQNLKAVKLSYSSEVHLGSASEQRLVYCYIE